MVQVIFDPLSVSLDDFIQEGGGYYFRGNPYQRGYGVGSVFRTWWRAILPFLKGAGKHMGKEALVTTAKILDNIAQGAELKETIKEEAKRGVKRMADRLEQSGSGVKRRKISKPKKKKPKKIRITKKSILGKRILKDLVMKNPKTKLGLF